MKKFLNLLGRLSCTGLLASAFMFALPATGNFEIGVGSAQAQNKQDKPERKTRRTPAMREQTFKRLEKAQEAQTLGDFAEALNQLDKLKSMRGKNSYETAMMWYYYAYIHYEQENLREAIQSYIQVIQQEDLPLGFEDQVIYNIAQLYFVIEDYENSLVYLDRWFQFAENPGPQQYVFKGQAHYALGQYKEGIVPIEKAIELAEAAGREPKENWYLLLRSAYYELGNMPRVRDLLEIMIIKYKKAEYWLQLAAIYSELHQEEKQLATMEVAYKQGFLTKENHLVNLAQLFLFNSVPIKAAQVLQKGFDDGIIQETEKNFDLLSQALIQSKEYADAVIPLGRAAELAEDGELYMRLGQVYMELDDWKNAVAAIDSGIDKGINRTDTAYLQLGQAYYNVDDLKNAEKAFRQAAKDKRSRKTANNWISFLEREQDRLRRLAEGMAPVGQ